MTVRAYGRDATLHMLRATTAGEAPTGNYYQLPFYSSDLGASLSREPDTLAGQGRDPQEQVDGALNVGGNVVVPIDPRIFGFWLTALLGDPTTTEDTGVYTHVFESGADTLPDYGIQTGHPKLQTPRYDMCHGVKVGSLNMSMQRSGQVQATLSCTGLDETKHGTTQAGTPQILTLSKFGHPTGVLKKGGTVLGNVNEFNFTFNNGLVPIESVNNAGKLEDIDPGDVSITGSVGVRFTDSTLVDAATNGTPIDLELSYTISASLKLTFEFHELYLDLEPRRVEGPGGISVNAPFKAVKNTEETCAMTVTLINDQAGTVYVPE